MKGYKYTLLVNLQTNSTEQDAISAFKRGLQTVAGSENGPNDYSFLMGEKKGHVLVYSNSLFVRVH